MPGDAPAPCRWAACHGDLLLVADLEARLQVQISLESSHVSLMTIGEVARRSGVAASALRFYEDRGLISSERAGAGHRRYSRPVLRRIAELQRPPSAYRTSPRNCRVVTEISDGSRVQRTGNRVLFSGLSLPVAG
jgi:hypothetical protein